MRISGRDNTSKEAELLSLLRREMNGAVVDSMREKGLEYKLSYGVSLADIKSISLSFGTDHPFAKHIYTRDMRELRLAAFHIADPSALTAEEIFFWADGITTTEIASVGALSLFSRSPGAEDYIFKFFETGRPILQYAAIMSAAANLMHTKNRPTWSPERLLQRVDFDKISDPAKWTGYLCSALSTLLDKLEPSGKRYDMEKD